VPELDIAAINKLLGFGKCGIIVSGFDDTCGRTHMPVLDLVGAIRRHGRLHAGVSVAPALATNSGAPLRRKDADVAATLT